MAHQNARGIAAVVGSAAFFVCNDSLMKLATASLPTMEVLTLRGVAASLWCLPVVLFLGEGRALRHLANRWVLLRSLFETVAIISFLMALVRVPIADVTAIFQIAPFLVLLGSWLIWGDRIGGVRFLFILVGIAGALLVAQPGSKGANPFALLGFITAAAAAARDMTSRMVPPQVPAIVVTFSTLSTVLVFGAAAMLVFEVPKAPDQHSLLLLVFSGLFLMLGHLLIFLAFRLAPARVIAPFYYSFTVWAVVIGYVVFGDVPNLWAVLGIGLILGSGLAVLALDRRR
jgi:drug/metabolite transporter (DMT)-like permease